MPSCGQHNSLASPWPFGVVQLEQNPVTSPWPFGMVNAAEVLWPAGVGASCSKRVQPEQHSLPAKEAKRAAKKKKRKAPVKKQEATTPDEE